MPLEIRADHSAILLFPPSVEEWVPSDHPARFIREVVLSLSLKDLGIKVRETTEGHPSYDPRLLLSAWLYGYLHRMRSSRELERACYEHIGLIWLLGRHTPDHNTLWRFFRDNRSALKSVFATIVHSAVSSGLVGMALHAVDGTKIQARSSNRTGYHEKQLSSMLTKLDVKIEQTLREIEQIDRQEHHDNDKSDDNDSFHSGYGLPKALTDPAVLKETVAESLRQERAARRTDLEEQHKRLETERTAARAAQALLLKEGRTHHHPAEPEARVMQLSGTPGGRAFSYNAQIAVDRQSGLILAEYVTTAENDQNQLVPVMEQVRSITGQLPADTVADAGYFTYEELHRLEQKDYKATIALRPSTSGEGQGPYHFTRFGYDAEQDELICPEGERLPFLQERSRELRDFRYTARRYQCQSAGSCKVRNECTKNAKGRLVDISITQPLIDKQLARGRTDEGKEHLRYRKAIVEPVFAWIKSHGAFKRFNAFGLANAQAQWTMVAIAHNLKRILAQWKKQKIALT